MFFLVFKKYTQADNILNSLRNITAILTPSGCYKIYVGQVLFALISDRLFAPTYFNIIENIRWPIFLNTLFLC